MTLNDSSSVTLTGDSGNPTRRYIGGNNPAGTGGTGVLTLNGSSTFTDQGAANAFNVGYQNGNGTLNVNTGATFTTGAEIRVAASNTNGDVYRLGHDQRRRRTPEHEGADPGA